VRGSIVAAIAAGCVMSCGSNDKAPEGAAGARSASSAGQDGGLPPCEESAPAVARLESYGNVHVPATYWVEMISDGSEWRPADPIAMPHHHASRLELANLADFPALAGRPRERVRFTVEITSRQIQQVSGRREWRATYHARIVAVCIPK
jgi:hypothetical protein